MGYNVNSNIVINDDQNVTLNSVSFNQNFLQVSQAMGNNFGYASGGVSPPTTIINVIQRFPFAAATTNSSDVGDLSGVRSAAAGQSSQTHGYSSGGAIPASTTIIDRFPFAVSSGLTASNIGNLTQSRSSPVGQSSTTHGYSSSGVIAPPATYSNVIDRFPFADSTVTATDVGDLTVARVYPGGHSSTTHGYTSGGESSSPANGINIIDRFPFSAATTNATDVGDLSAARLGVSAGQSSTDFGYISGGFTVLANPVFPSPQFAGTNVIDRFPFAATTTNAADVGDLTLSRYFAASQSSFEHGYTTGGGGSRFAVDPVPTANTIDRFPFAAATTNAADVGDILATNYFQTGQQY